MCESKTEVEERFVLINKLLILFVKSTTSSLNKKVSTLKGAPAGTPVSTPKPAPSGLALVYP